MSATNRGKEREANDFYATPAWCVHRLFEDEHFLDTHITPASTEVEDQVWLEPGCGEGAIIQALDQIGVSPNAWVAVDDENRKLSAENIVFEHVDFLKFEPEPGEISVAIGNPPYSLAKEFVDHALKISPVVIMLLRVNFLGSEKRVAWWRGQKQKPDIYVLPNRPVFTVNKEGKPGVDATEYAWFVWGPRSKGHWFLLESTDEDTRGEAAQLVVEKAKQKPAATTEQEATPEEMLELLELSGLGLPQIGGELAHLLFEDVPAHGVYAGAGELAQKRVNTVDELARLVMSIA